MMGEHGMAWPWESLHIEALAWFDYWLKGREGKLIKTTDAVHQSLDAPALLRQP
jgi:hypothetical protein